MSRIPVFPLSTLLALVLIAVTSGCAPHQKAGQGSTSSGSPDLPELTKEIIDERINDARVYDNPPEDGKGQSITWGFDEDEPKEIVVVDKQVNGTHATIVLDIKTSTNPRRRGPQRHLSGQIRTEWELRTGWVLRRWEIIDTENISMKYRDDPPPASPN